LKITAAKLRLFRNNAKCFQKFYPFAARPRAKCSTTKQQSAEPSLQGNGCQRVNILGFDRRGLKACEIRILAVTLQPQTRQDNSAEKKSSGRECNRENKTINN
jgi:hypothetical protein